MTLKLKFAWLFFLAYGPTQQRDPSSSSTEVQSKGRFYVWWRGAGGSAPWFMMWLLVCVITPCFWAIKGHAGLESRSQFSPDNLMMVCWRDEKTTLKEKLNGLRALKCVFGELIHCSPPRTASPHLECLWNGVSDTGPHHHQHCALKKKKSDHCQKWNVECVFRLDPVCLFTFLR